MKKLLLIFLLFSKILLFSQTVLNSFPLTLNNLGKTQILNAEDEINNSIYVFAFDDKNINILKYNKFLFLTNQFTDSIQGEKNRNLIGYSINKEQKPTLYWSSLISKNILITTYDLDNKPSKSLNFNFPRNHEYIINSFQQDNAFYILAKEVDFEHLLLYKFEDGKCEIRTFDFSSFVFRNKIGVQISFNSLIISFPIKKMDPDIPNPIDLATGTSKLYIEKDRLILTIDNGILSKTQVFDLKMSTGDVTERMFSLPVSENPSQTANSFYYDKKLFQVVANEDQFLLEIKDFESGNSIKNYTITKKDIIPFKISPFSMQVNNGKLRQLQSTEKFLKNLDGLTPGISVIANQKNFFITFSGFGDEKDFYYANDSDDDFGQRNYYSVSKVVYFDAMLNENLDPAKGRQPEPLAIDNLFYFLHLNKNITLYDALKLKHYYLLSYYDNVSQQFKMRKFIDGFMIEDNGNPIMNKVQFSKPTSFGSIKTR